MRVLVITNLFPSRARPVWGIHVFNNIRALAGRCAVRVIAPVPFVPRVLQRGSYARLASSPTRDTFDGIPVVYPRFVVPPRIGRPLHGVLLALWVLPSLRRALRDHRPDVVLSYFAYPDGFAAVLLARAFNLPVVVSCRGSDINRMARMPVHRRLIGWALRRADAVIAVSEALAVEIRALGVSDDRLRIVPNGVDGEIFRPRNRSESRRQLVELGAPAFDGALVVCVSRLSEEKGIDVLLRAWARVAPVDAALAIVGDGAAREALVKLAAREGIAARVYFALSRPHGEIPLWWGACNAAVLPSRSEGFPNAALEAVASGRPVVASDVGGVGEIVASPQLGTLVPVGDESALARALSDALAREWNAGVIAETARSRTWERVSAETEKVLQESAKNERRRSGAASAHYRAGV